MKKTQKKEFYSNTVYLLMLSLFLLITLLGCESTNTVTGNDTDNRYYRLGSIHLSTNGGSAGLLYKDTTVYIPAGVDKIDLNFNADTDGGYCDFIAFLNIQKNNQQIIQLINAEYINGPHKYQIPVSGVDSVKLYISLFCDGGGQEPCETSSYFNVTEIFYQFKSNYDN